MTGPVVMTPPDLPESSPDDLDPVQFDYQATSCLVARYHEPIEDAISRIENAPFMFESMLALHRDAIDPELIYRQALPVAGVGIESGLGEQRIAEYLELFLRAQTLLLNHIDRHLDLSSSYSLRNPVLLLRDVRSTMCYAVTSLYRAMALSVSSPDTSRAAGAMATISSVIVQSMHDNYARRFNEEALLLPEALVREYLLSERSRHLGSGFYSSGLLGLYAYAAFTVPSGLPELLRNMRRLRQRVDEIADIQEDAITGLITYPVALLLTERQGLARREADDLLRGIWSRAQRIIADGGGDALRLNRLLIDDTVLASSVDVLRHELSYSGIFERVEAEATTLWRDTRAAAQAILEPGPARVLQVVMDLKFALLRRLHNAGWTNPPPPHAFEDIRSRFAGGDVA